MNKESSATSMENVDVLSLKLVCRTIYALILRRYIADIHLLSCICVASIAAMISCQSMAFDCTSRVSLSSMENLT